MDAWESPNAAATGLGPTRRIIVWNTLVDSFDEDEVRAVLGHELGHHSRNHLWKSLAWYALFAIPGAFLIAWAARRRGGMREPAAVPLALLVFVVLQTLALPLQNAITRNMEAEADWVSLETTRDPESTSRLWRGLRPAGARRPEPADLVVPAHGDAPLDGEARSPWPRPGASATSSALGAGAGLVRWPHGPLRHRLGRPHPVREARRRL